MLHLWINTKAVARSFRRLLCRKHIQTIRTSFQQVFRTSITMEPCAALLCVLYHNEKDRTNEIKEHAELCNSSSGQWIVYYENLHYRHCHVKWVKHTKLNNNNQNNTWFLWHFNSHGGGLLEFQMKLLLFVCRVHVPFDCSTNVIPCNAVRSQ